MDRDELTQRATDMARVAATYAFGRRTDREELISDAVSTAWQFAQTAGSEATPQSIVHYAIKRVRSGIFPGSQRSIEHRNPRNRRPTVRVDVDVDGYARVGDDPGLIVMVKLDAAAWLATLPALKRAVAVLFAAGWRTQEIARLLKRSDARISQIRDELRHSWREFTDG